MKQFAGKYFDLRNGIKLDRIIKGKGFCVFANMDSENND